MDETELPLLYGAFKKLSSKDLSLLADGVVNGFSQSFLAAKYSSSQSAVPRRLKTIMKKVREDINENPELKRRLGVFRTRCGSMRDHGAPLG